MSIKILLVVGSLLAASALFFRTGPIPAQTVLVPNLPTIVQEKAIVTPPIVTINSKRIEKLVLPASKVIFINGPIMDNAAFIVDEIKLKSKTETELYLLINSPGGSVLDGALIISAMEASPVPVHTVCLQMCASMAFGIHQYGVRRLAVDRSVLMAHQAAGGLQGSLGQMQARLDMITRYVFKMDAHVSSRTGVPLDKFHSLIASEFWVDAEDGLEKKYVDALVSIETEAKPPTLIGVFSEQTKETTDSKIDIIW